MVLEPTSWLKVRWARPRYLGMEGMLEAPLPTPSLQPAFKASVPAVLS